MTIRAKLIIYLLIVHLVLAAAGTLWLWEDYRPYMLVLEFILIISFLIGIRITRSYDVHLEIVSAGTEFIRDRDFSHTFGEVSASDINNLILMYNEMITRLREERIQGEERQAFLHRILDATSIGIITLDFDGKIDIINPAACEILNLDITQTGKNIELKNFESLQVKQLLDLELNQSKVIKLPDRKQIKCSHSQYFDKGFPKSFYMISDVTKELWRNEKEAYEKLIRILSHEVNNTIGPTNSILQSCIYYSNQLNDEDRIDFENALNVAIDRTNNLNEFMQNYADVVRLPDPTYEEINISNLLNKICLLMEPECDARKIVIECDIESENVYVTVDQNQLEQVLVNIVRNSIDAIGEKGKIKVRLRKINNSDYNIIIEDNGSGISDETKSNLFTPFFSTKENGQGIGLTLVQEILNRHNFDFSLESSNNLTEFKIMLSNKAHLESRI